MYGRRARSSRASAALILAICISDSAPSIIRAPPEQDTMITGLPVLDRRLDGPGDLLADHHAHAAADERVLHRGHHDVSMPPICPVAVMTASIMPVAAMVVSRRF